MKLYTFDPGKYKKVLCGELVGNTLFRWVKPEHFMRINQSYGIQEIAFQEMILKGVKIIVLKELGTGKEWEAPTDVWKEAGTVQDYGHGKQRFLSMRYQKPHKNALIASDEKRHLRELEIMKANAQRFREAKGQQTIW